MVSQRNIRGSEGREAKMEDVRREDEGNEELGKKKEIGSKARS